jgi:phosphoserine aminotransferase
VEFPEFPAVLAPKADGTGPIVVADMSSNILSRRIPVTNYSLLFFGAQKNLGSTGVTVAVLKKSFLPPTTAQPSALLLRKLGLPIPPIILQYEIIAKNNSLYNTLSIFEYASLSMTPYPHQDGADRSLAFISRAKFSRSC